MSFLGEIKRRKVFQVAAVYAVVAWLLIQVADVVLPAFEAPTWVLRVVIFLLILGLPITLIISWAFNLTPEGLVRDQGRDALNQGGGRRIEYVFVGLVVIALGWLVFRVEFDSGGVPSDRREGVQPNSVAVLLFENLSPDPDNAYFAAGIHESTLNQLAKIRDLTVMARTSVMQYENDPPTIPEIAEALNVETVMEGSVRYANGRVLITAQLIDGRNGAHLWSDEYDRELTDVFAVQAEVAKHIATAMQVQLLPDEQSRIEKRPTKSTEAYQHYLYALSLPDWVVYRDFAPEYIESLERAIGADPEFAEAFAALAYGNYRVGDRSTAVAYAQKAIELDPTVGRAYVVLGLISGNYYSRQQEARAAFERAAALSPNDPEILLEHASHLGEQWGDYAEAIRIGQRAIAVDPDGELPCSCGGIHGRIGFLYLRAGDLAAAARHLREAIRLQPGNYLLYLDQASVDYLNGDRSAAKENSDRAAETMSSDTTFRVGYLAHLYGLLGESDQSAELLARNEEIIGDPQRNNWRSIGWAVLGTRDKEEALREWTMTVDGYIDDDQPVSPGRISRFRDNWLNDPMLEEPEFLELRRRLGFKA